MGEAQLLAIIAVISKTAITKLSIIKMVLNAKPTVCEIKR
jgi:hypothetical protein